MRAKKLAPGEKLPSISEPAVLYKVSPSTVKQVYVRLEALRVIWRHQGLRQRPEALDARTLTRPSIPAPSRPRALRSAR
ncbi:GntR family transcriptional regulator [Micromonospora wenchangensis]|uniref:GntR family transcriptional regulator n=1 Tax=Micromonospora wenchangensis TaxID=1185415 RepID=UPI003807BFB0